MCGGGQMGVWSGGWSGPAPHVHSCEERAVFLVRGTKSRIWRGKKAWKLFWPKKKAGGSICSSSRLQAQSATCHGSMAAKRRRADQTQASAAQIAPAEAALPPQEDLQQAKRRKVALADTQRQMKRPVEPKKLEKRQEKLEEDNITVEKKEKAEDVAASGEKTPEGCEFKSPQSKKRARVASTSPPTPPPVLATPPRPAKLRRTASAASQNDDEEDKPRVPVRVPSLGREEEEDVPKENLEALHTPCRNSYKAQVPRLEILDPRDSDEVKRQQLLRSLQVTPPPSARMLDKKNPPPPPPRPKRRRFVRPGNPVPSVGVIYTRSYPRLALSPLVDSPPTSPTSPPRVFRSLADDFAMAVHDTPQQPRRVRPEPQIGRGSRRSRSGNSSSRRSIDTPTSTMVLRSRQLNHNTQPSLSKPENAREREQRESHQRERRGV